MAVLFHIAARVEWEAGIAAGAYRTGSLEREGFIHCSDADQVSEVANRLFRGRTDLVLLFVDADRLRAPVRREVVADPPGAVFPHVYGPIEPNAVFEVGALTPGVDGRFAVDLQVIALGAFGDAMASETAARARAAMAGLTAPWWVAGGWAVELHLARTTRARSRPHADLEIAILRRDQRALFDHLTRQQTTWQLCPVVRPGLLGTWDGSPLPPTVHQIWARHGAPIEPRAAAFAAEPTHLEILFEEADGERWRFRRQPEVERAITDFGAIDADGTPFVRPEVVLLYKAKHRRYKDERDLAAVAPTLDGAARAWLVAALDRTHPGHPWRTLLQAGPGKPHAPL